MYVLKKTTRFSEVLSLGVRSIMKPPLYSSTCVIENVLGEFGLQRETLWSLNSFTKEQYSCYLQGVCDMNSLVRPFQRDNLFFFKAQPFGTRVRFALLRLLALCY